MGIGIDYGRGMTNVDHKTGIRYGVINQHEIMQAWCDTSEPYYGELDEDEELSDFAEPISFYVDDNEYSAEAGESGDIFITKSLYYTRAAYCSPCAPGACHLRNPHSEGDKAYCFGHDWFDSEKAPYPVYRVSDDTLVNP